MGGKWTTIVGDHAPRVEPPPPPKRVVRYVLQEAVPGEYRPVANMTQRERLLYERGVGPLRPDDKPEPHGGPHDRRTFRPAKRPAQPWSGRA